MPSLSTNQIVPNFEALSTADSNFQLTNHQGKNIILYFYPRDNTPGCTTEGQDFRDNIEKFNTLNTVIFGISRDSVRVHQGFKDKHAFPFDLLSDKDEKICDLFDTIKMKTLYGKQVRGIERSTFLIDTQGTLIYEWRKVKVKNHIDDILQKIADLTTP